MTLEVVRPDPGRLEIRSRVDRVKLGLGGLALVVGLFAAGQWIGRQLDQLPPPEGERRARKHYSTRADHLGEFLGLGFLAYGAYVLGDGVRRRREALIVDRREGRVLVSPAAGGSWLIREVTGVEVVMEGEGPSAVRRLVLRRRAGEPLAFPPGGIAGDAAALARVADELRAFLAAHGRRDAT